MLCIEFNKQTIHYTGSPEAKILRIRVIHTLDFLVNLSLSNLIAVTPPMSEKNRRRSSSFAYRERVTIYFIEFQELSG